MKSIIEVNNLSKQYRLGTVGTGSITHDVNRWWHRVRGKEDPYLEIGETNDRSTKGESEYVWALRDINFTVMPGEILGIIGRNGAGKSTLLKILSRITTPTTGSVSLRGRVASLLEVGTGMHPELTGRENIYLNGAILGMRKKEISQKLDEIIDFSGVERYIDTPVKRYSSGMHVRLGFAVAAHLEPEILIVDEVLAVGDADFQKKCLGKMKDVSSNEGRTILFVSHNIVAVKNLCTRGLMMVNGSLAMDGPMAEIADAYLIKESNLSQEKRWDNDKDAPGNEHITLVRAAAFARGKKATDPIKSNETIVVELEFINKVDNVDLDVTWDMFDAEGIHVFHVGTLVGEGKNADAGKYLVGFEIPGQLLNNTRYIFNVMFGVDQRTVVYKSENILVIDVEDGLLRKGVSYHKYPGVIHPALACKTEKLYSF